MRSGVLFGASERVSARPAGRAALTMTTSLVVSTSRRAAPADKSGLTVLR
jgi:hypothetical protein